MGSMGTRDDDAGLPFGYEPIRGAWAFVSCLDPTCCYGRTRILLRWPRGQLSPLQLACPGCSDQRTLLPA